MKTEITEYGTYVGKHPNIFLMKCLFKRFIKIIFYPFIYMHYIFHYKNIWNLKKHLKDKKINKGLMLSFYLDYQNKHDAYLGINSEFADIPCLPHGIHGLFVSENAKVGKNCVIFHQVTIGSNMIEGSKTFGYPTIGDNVYIGAGAKIIGNVTIGNNCRIGANAVVTEDMKENTVAVAEKTRYITKKKKLDNRYIIKSKSGYFYYENGSYKKMEDQNAK